MNTDISAAFQRLSWRVIFAALLSSVALHAQAQARPSDPPWLIPPKVDQSEQSADTRIWRYVPIGPRGTYRPVVRIEAKPSAPMREVVRWVGPRGTVPIYRNE
jgi:hypothetical protein